MEQISVKTLNRIQKSKLNTTVILASSIIMGVFSFIERSVFNHYFIADYLGLYSFFNNILGILSTVELGISTSITFALYAPIEYGRKDQIESIMRFFREIYVIIGFIIFAAGLAVIPLFPHIINTSIPLQKVTIYYMFFLLRTTSNFWFGYRGILFTANQEGYKAALTTNLSWAVLYILEIIVSITTQSFFIYCFCIFGVNLLRILIIYLLNVKEFGLFNKFKHVQIDSSIKKHIAKNTKGLIITRLSQVMVSATDSVLISALVGTAFLGQYSNYQVITEGVRTITNILPQSIVASVGNAGVTETRRTMSRSFETLNLASFLINCLFTVLLISISDSIVATFFGADRLLSTFSVILICINFYLTSQREILLTFKSSLGLYWEDRKRPIAEGVTNLVTSILLGLPFGFNGIIAGTIITNVFVNFIIEPRVIYHSGLHSSSFWYYTTFIIRLILTIALSLICRMLTNFIPVYGLINLIARILLTTILCIFILFLIYRKDPTFSDIKDGLKIAFKKKVSAS